MKRLIFPLLSWLLICAGAFFLTRGALEVWESHKAQTDIAATWNNSASSVEQDNGSGPSATSNQDGPVVPRKVSTSASRSVPSRKGEAVARLSIPRLSTVLYVVEGTEDRDLKRGPGHLEGSVLPGQGGNCIIAGHRDTHFKVLKDIQRGDEILLERGGKEYRYEVQGISVVTPDNTASLLPTRDAELHLITCFPFQYVGSAPRRFVVTAKLHTS